MDRGPGDGRFFRWALAQMLPCILPAAHARIGLTTALLGANPQLVSPTLRAANRNPANGLAEKLQPASTPYCLHQPEAGKLSPHFSRVSINCANQTTRRRRGYGSCTYRLSKHLRMTLSSICRVQFARLLRQQIQTSSLPLGSPCGPEIPRQASAAANFGPRHRS